jgi:hypothetical protein
MKYQTKISPYLGAILDNLIMAMLYDLACHDLAPKPTDGGDIHETRDRYLRSAYFHADRIPFRGDI